MSVSRHRDGGFSFVELMTIIVIVGVLVGIAIATYTASIERAGAVACENNRRFIERVSLAEYRIDHGTSPSTLDDLAPYAVNWNAVRACPTGDEYLLFLDAGGQHVVCPKHGR
ncbi:MAG: prepilin-type N-terminal cleavage/methylation domain-containing protein [Clostridiales bacterium]|nr:prepilin-type N-terminal cleavage/methylation domain-containing protein [Clostridiales bacterium]